MNTVESIKLSPSWKSRLLSEFQKPYMSDLRSFLRTEISSGKQIFPRGNEIFSAFDQTDFDQVKVVILGQDPYHGEGQAHGLCFSVRHGVKPPPSLKNIFKELKSDLGLSIPDHGNLSNWAKQGVLLLNTVLTVESGIAASHRGKGWERFSDRVIQLLSAREQPIVFLLWGAFAQTKASLIRTPPHYVLRAPHPSPLSAHQGFLGCKHFSKTNQILRELGISEINWSV